MSDSFETPRACVAYQAPLSGGFPRQEHWSGLPFPSPGDLPNSGIELMSHALVGKFFTTEPPGKSSSLFRYMMALEGFTIIGAMFDCFPLLFWF